MEGKYPHYQTPYPHPRTTTGMRPNQSEILILGYSQTGKKIIRFVFCCSCNSSTAHISGTNRPISVGFSAKCSFANILIILSNTKLKFALIQCICSMVKNCGQPNTGKFFFVFCFLFCFVSCFLFFFLLGRAYGVKISHFPPKRYLLQSSVKFRSMNILCKLLLGGQILTKKLAIILV